MSPETATPPPVTIVVYDRGAVYVLLREWTPAQLHEALASGAFGRSLAPAQAAELEALLTAWLQRALGSMSLRDALLVDQRRGRRVFDLLCVTVTCGQAAVPAELAAALPPAPAELTSLPPALLAQPELAALAHNAGAHNLALAVQAPADSFPFPDDLLALPPPAPSPIQPAGPPFEQPTGWRRRIAALLATAGVALLVMPLLLGQIPDHPAGLPLALLTLALLVGIRAGPAGFAGSLCVWLVANLPGFRHGSTLLALLWPGLPLMIAGLLLLGLDRRVRAMWRWLRRQLVGG